MQIKQQKIFSTTKKREHVHFNDNILDNYVITDSYISH